MAATVERRKISVPQLSRIWGVSTNKVVAFILSGELRATNMASRQSSRPRYSIDVDDVEAFEKSRQVVPDGGESTTKKLRRRAADNPKAFF